MCIKIKRGGHMEVDKKNSDECHKRSLRYVAIKFNGTYKVLA